MSEIPLIFATAHLMGGLGNQMFQISHAVSQGLKNNIPTLFIPTAYTPMQANQPTKYLNNIFKKIKFVDELNGYTVIESPWQYVNLNLKWDTSIQFFGYFQSSKNFLGFNNTISELFQPSEDEIFKLKEKYPQINNKNTVSLHIRRGDYLTIGHILPVIDKTYIDRCIELVGDYNHLFVFSDDKKWTEENLNYPNMTIVSDLEDYEDLWLISMCNHNIMSNSSFSWWGSFLNKNEDKKVFVPSIWFGPMGEQNFNDIYEKNWNKINVIYKNNKLVYEN
jgi:signal peptidase I